MSKPVKKRFHLRSAAVLLLLAILTLSACGVQEEAAPTVTSTRPVTPTASSRPVTPATSTRPPEVIVVRPDEIPEVMITATLPSDKILETENFEFYVEDSYGPADTEQFAATAESIYAEVSARMGAQMGTEMAAQGPDTIILSFERPQDVPCRARGWTFSDEFGSRVTIFVDEQTEEAQIRGVLAHELAHVIHATGFERMLDGERNLTEGLATWITRDYWTAWQETSTLEEMVRGYLEAGDYVPLAEADVFSAYPRSDGRPQEDCLGRRDLLYSQWASFVGYLVEAHGWETFVELMASAAPEVTEDGEVFPRPADYLGTYGKSLEALEGEWLAQIRE